MKIELERNQIMLIQDVLNVLADLANGRIEADRADTVVCNIRSAILNARDDFKTAVDKAVKNED
uniref:Uncharacterized protein n=1 Tax=Siphoviridae sp. ctJ3t72 TaxID=2826240 RepID=A0A8S5QPA3_9CAUD|nr:MAG TPA: hypothetical protein [Siphoviridae sp. ctJ3t72]